MAVSRIISSIDLSDGWKSTDLDGESGGYLIAVKNNKSNQDTIDPKDVKRITIELGIACGVTDTNSQPVPMPIQRIVLNFNDIISPASPLNGKVAFSKLFGVPDDLYIRVVSLDDGLREYVDGTTSIEINTNPVKFIIA